MNSVYFKNFLKKFLFVAGCLLSCSLLAQQGLSVDIDKIMVEGGDLVFRIKCLEDGKLKEDLNRTAIKVTEQTPNKEAATIEVYEINKETLYASGQTQSKGAAISFLLDVSRAMDEISLTQAKGLVRQVVNDKAAQNGSTFYLTTYHETIDIKNRRLTPETVDDVLAGLTLAEKEPDFYNSLQEEIKHLKAFSGTNTLFIMGTGEHFSEHLNYQGKLPYTKEDIKDLVKSLPLTFRIFGIGFNEDEPAKQFNFLDNGKIPYKYTNSKLPEDYKQVFGDNRVVLSNYILKATPEDNTFKGQKRVYTVNIENATDNKDFRLGLPTFPVILDRSPTWGSWLIWFIMGIIGVLIIFGVGSLLIPYLKEKEFVKNYVIPYKPEANRKQYDIFYNEPIEAGEMVVSKCRQITPFSSWKENGWQCPNYPICLNQNCSGSGAPEQNNFFTMEGIFLKLNWIWFGAIGGLLAWVLISLFRVTQFQWLTNILSSFVGADFLKSISPDNPDLVAQAMGNNLLVGISFGAGLMLMLSWMDERRASNKYSVSKSISRIAMRTLGGILFAMLVFFIGFYLQYMSGVSPYLSGLFSWLLFGLGVGLILSIYSSLSVVNSIIGGILASFLAFHVYWGLSEFLNIGFMPANLLSMILMGGLIGSILVSVVTTLEDYELKIVAPIHFQRTIAISKWLESNIPVLIGKLAGSYIYIKWEDEAVQPEHAELFSEDGHVFIRPMDEVLLNDKIIAKPTPLKNGDIIQLGAAGKTKFQFVEK